MYLHRNNLGRVERYTSYHEQESRREEDGWRANSLEEQGGVIWVQDGFREELRHSLTQGIGVYHRPNGCDPRKLGKEAVMQQSGVGHDQLVAIASAYVLFAQENRREVFYTEFGWTLKEIAGFVQGANLVQNLSMDDPVRKMMDPDRMDDLPLAQTQMLPRYLNALELKAITTIGALYDTSVKDLLAIDHFGEAGVRGCRRALESCGMYTGSQLEITWIALVPKQRKPKKQAE